MGGRCSERVILTRSLEDIERDRKLFEKLGFAVVPLPLIETVPLDFQVPEDNFDFVIFQSAKAVRYFLRKAKLPPSTKIVAVGKKTEKALEEWGYRADIIPEDYSAGGIVKSLPEGRGETVLIPRSEEGRREAIEGLEKKGYRVLALNIYRTTELRHDPALIEGSLSAGGFIVFASPSAVRSFFANLQKDKASLILRSLVVVAVGKTTKGELEKRGVEVNLMPAKPLMEEVAGKIHSYWQENCKK